ncbi:hypothetical protein QWI49_14260 [Acinetobacter nosocomialis]|uniref:hypothetical protein n=1 Tax=Acinetobacter nosocomialis TaxID=106654 RepID=UPI000DE6BCA0|nr:hypothetical protein [Acinetobacter nosocomialis]MDP7776302.1 hypothetical protein [Acinetobacter nosocomialis]SSV49499.1 Uncharacterised protein [Acinetobacter nosocomialis]
MRFFLIFLMVFLGGCRALGVNKDYYFQQGFNASTVVNLTNYVYIIKELQKHDDVSIDIYIPLLLIAQDMKRISEKDLTLYDKKNLCQVKYFVSNKYLNDKRKIQNDLLETKKWLINIDYCN